MSQWHPLTDTNATAANWRAHSERWRDIHSPTYAKTDRLRRLIQAASQNNRLSSGQHAELLGVVTQIDDEKRGR